MLLNAHTATRSFRELQFDLKAFLEAFAEIMPLDELSDEGLVEIKWADGSVDMVPTFKFITGIVHNRFPELLIGETAELVPGKQNVAFLGGKYYNQMLTLFFKKAGLSARVRNLGGPDDDLKFVKGVIKSLEADTITLGDGIELSSLKVLGVLSAEVCTADESEFTYVEAERTKVSDRCDLSKITYTGTLNTPYTFSHNISSLNFAPYSYEKDRAWGYCYVNGTASCGNCDDSTIDAYRRYRATVYFELPLPDYSKWRHTFWSYVKTKGERIPLKNDTKFDLDTDANLLMLYPKKQAVYYENARKYDEYYRILPPSADDKDAIISIRNVSNETIHAVNAWRFDVNTTLVNVGAAVSVAAAVVGDIVGSAGNGQTSSNSGVKTGVIMPLSYIDLPPYSAVEFLLQYEMVGQRLQVYLLPMCALPETTED